MFARFCKALCLSVALGGLLAGHATADQTTCRPIVAFRESVLAKGGQWVKLTPEQFQFMRGVYAEAPSTPTELPIGDSAVIAIVPDEDVVGLFFLDGDMSCVSPISLKPQWKELIDQIGAGEIRHAGNGS